MVNEKKSKLRWLLLPLSPVAVPIAFFGAIIWGAVQERKKYKQRKEGQK